MAMKKIFAVSTTEVKLKDLANKLGNKNINLIFITF